MANPQQFSTTQVIICAVQYCIDANIPALQSLIARRPETLYHEFVLRLLLTFLPESTEPSLYIPLLEDISNDNISIDHAQLQSKSEKNELADVPDEENARKRLRKLRLLHLADPDTPHEAVSDALTAFLIHRARRIDANTGLLPIIFQLVEPFVGRSDHLRIWVITRILPLFRFSYEYYPEGDTITSLSDFEAMHGSSAINFLLSKCLGDDHEENENNLTRDLRGLVGPWMYGSSFVKRRKLNEVVENNQNHPTGEIFGKEDGLQSNVNEHDEWRYVNEWLLSTAMNNFATIGETFGTWDGPGDVDLGGYMDEKKIMPIEYLQSRRLQYLQAGLAIIYSANHASPDVFDYCSRIVARITQVMGVDRSPDSAMPIIDLSAEYIAELSKSQLEKEIILLPDDSLTFPTDESIQLVSGLLRSAYLLVGLGVPLSCRDLAEICLFGDTNAQNQLLQKTLHSVNTKIKLSKDAEGLRQQLLWLKKWTPKESQSPSVGIFSKVTMDSLERGFLELLVQNEEYNVASRIYLGNSSLLLSRDRVEQIIVEAILGAYDNASNGNRSRGGVKKASDILAAFRDMFPESCSFRQIEALLNATHALSFYSLILEHGVPFRPVNIRVHHDPILLINKVLEQNLRSYTKLDDLIGIGRNLIRAGLPMSKPEIVSSQISLEKVDLKVVFTERRIMGMAIEAALSEDDFETAYSYCLNKLAYISTSGNQEECAQNQDDILWRAAYHAGRYRSSNQVSSSASTLRQLEQRMELLSKALILAPPAALSEILGVWRRCEEEMAVLRAQEVHEEESWNSKGDMIIPGGFTLDQQIPGNEKRREPARGSNREDAPMGLFDVARGAAAALSKTAFPLRNNTTEQKDRMSIATPDLDFEGRARSGSESTTGTNNEGKVRKRDMVSRAVTGGLASGLGWVLGKENNGD
ncbi:MAG: hypothetical protein M1834_009635 [Cirrosporium novae-zelandiae]|nr:MAG: hypothetical protein M1834_009635 [Cirrosporium novae-zelandiae]